MKELLLRTFKESIVKKVSGVLVVRVIGTALGLISHITIARIIGAEEYGIYSLVLSWLIIISLFSRIGLDNMVIRYISKYFAQDRSSEAKALVSYSVSLILKINIVLILIASLFIFLFLDPLVLTKSTFQIGIVLCLPLLSMLYLTQSILNGLKLVDISNIPLLIVRHSVLICLVLIFKDTLLTAPRIMVFNAIALLIGLFLSRFWIIRKIKSIKKIVVTKKQKKSWINESLPFLFYSGANNINSRVDLLVLGFFASPEQIGIYAAVTRVKPLLSFFHSILNTATKPYISEYYTSEMYSKLRGITFYSVFVASVLSIIISVGFYLWGDDLLSLFGAKFPEGYTILLILISANIFGVFTGFSAPMLAMTDNQKLASQIEFGSVVFNIIFCLFAAKYYGVIGVAYATSFVYIIKNIFNSYMAYRKVNINTTLFNPGGFKRLVPLYRSVLSLSKKSRT